MAFAIIRSAESSHGGLIDSRCHMDNGFTQVSRVTLCASELRKQEAQSKAQEPMHNYRRAIIFIMILPLSACATRAIGIEPIPTDAHAFFGETCSELVAERAKRTQALIFSGLAQDQISEDDRTRTLGIPTPMGSAFYESKANQIARLKGELRAISATLASLNCGSDYR